MDVPNRIAAARDIRADIGRLRDLFARSPGFMCVVIGPDHVIEATNSAYDDLVGGRAVIGTKVRDAVPEIVEQGFIDTLDKVYNSGQPLVAKRVPAVLARQKGLPPEKRWLDLVYQPIFDDDGTVGGIFCQGVDVTEVHAAREALGESESRLRDMADHAPVMLWVTAPDGNCVWLNARWYEYTGQTEPEALGLGWTDAIHPDERAMAGEAFLAANAARAPFRIEYRLRGTDGGYRWSIDAAAPRFSSRGTFLGFVGSVIDIDDRRATEDRLRASEARFRAAVGAIQGVLWTNSPDGRMTGAQPGWSALTGQTIETYSGFGWSAAIHPDDVQPTLDAWNAAVARQHLFQFEHRVRRADGSWGNYAVRAIPIVEDGAILEWVGVHADITEQRAAEAALHALNATLEDRIAAELRHRAEIEAALRQSQKMEAIGQLTSGLAHDFNNMLTVVISGLHILGRNLDPDNAKAHRYLDASLDGARRAAGLVDRLMAFSRQQPLALASTDINAVIDGMRDMLANTLDGRVALAFDLDHSLPRLETDAGLLESAILNLAVNARDAMPDGGSLRIATRPIAIDAAAAARHAIISGDYALISVADTGIGMAPDVIEKAFNPFFTTKEIGKGTGLGLSQVHGFVRQCGGSITIDSALGEGTEVRILLPLGPAR